MLKTIFSDLKKFHERSDWLSYAAILLNILIGIKILAQGNISGIYSILSAVLLFFVHLVIVSSRATRAMTDELISEYKKAYEKLLDTSTDLALALAKEIKRLKAQQEKGADATKPTKAKRRPSVPKARSKSARN